MPARDSASSVVRRPAQLRPTGIRLAKLLLSGPIQPVPPQRPDLRPARRPIDGGAHEHEHRPVAPADGLRERERPTASAPGWPSRSRPDPVTGALDWLSGAALVRQSIRLILETEPGERVMRPTFGAGLRRYLMDPNTPATRAQIALDVQAALATWEPRIMVTAVTVEPGDDPAEASSPSTYVHVRDQSPGSVDCR